MAWSRSTQNIPMFPRKNIRRYCYVLLEESQIILGGSDAGKDCCGGNHFDEAF